MGTPELFTHIQTPRRGQRKRGKVTSAQPFWEVERFSLKTNAGLWQVLRCIFVDKYEIVRFPQEQEVWPDPGSFSFWRFPSDICLLSLEDQWCSSVSVFCVHWCSYSSNDFCVLFPHWKVLLGVNIWCSFSPAPSTFSSYKGEFSFCFWSSEFLVFSFKSWSFFCDWIIFSPQGASLNSDEKMPKVFCLMIELNY